MSDSGIEKPPATEITIDKIIPPKKLGQRRLPIRTAREGDERLAARFIKPIDVEGREK